MKKYVACFALILMIMLTTADPSTADGISYVFDQVEVSYAAEFTCLPVNVDEENWLVQLAGGVNEPITVLLGDVTLLEKGRAQFSEQFIKVTGKNGSERFLINSGSYSGSVVKSFYWSAKRLIGNEVVKDFTGPVISLTLYRYPGSDHTYEKILLTASNDGLKASDEFWHDHPVRNLYEADLSTLHHSGTVSTELAPEIEPEPGAEKNPEPAPLPEPVSDPAKELEPEKEEAGEGENE
jgi:hypothetical protein